MNRDRAAGQRMAEAGLPDLPGSWANSDGIIFCHHSLDLYCEDPVQVGPAGTPESRAFFCRGYAEPGVELPDVLLAQECIGSFQSCDPRQSQFLRQAALSGSETPFRPSARLW